MLVNSNFFFFSNKPEDSESYVELDNATVEFFKSHNISEKDLVIVDENQEDQTLFNKLQESLVYETYDSTVQDSGLIGLSFIYIYTKPFLCVYGSDNGFTWIVLPFEKALELLRS